MAVGDAGVHGDGEQGMAVAELVVREAGLFGAEEQGDLFCWVLGESSRDGLIGFGEHLKGMLEDALAYGGGAEDESAVGDGFGYGGKFDGGGEDAGGVDRSPFRSQRRLERDWEFVDDAEVGEAEIVDGAGGGADVGRIAGADEDYDDAILVFGEHRFILGVGGWVKGETPCSTRWGCVEHGAPRLRLG
jgi:hypothetical protein